MSPKARLPESVAHGTNHGYVNLKCRCDLCRGAYQRYRAALRARDPEKYTAYMREYMRKYRSKKREEQAARPQ